MGTPQTRMCALELSSETLGGRGSVPNTRARCCLLWLPGHILTSEGTHTLLLGRGDLLVPLISTMTAVSESGAKWPRSGYPLPVPSYPHSHVLEEALHCCLPLC